MLTRSWINGPDEREGQGGVNGVLMDGRGCIGMELVQGRKHYEWTVKGYGGVDTV